MKNESLLRAALLFASFFIIHTIQAQQRSLWATAVEGGMYGYGTILRGEADGSNFHRVYSFDDTVGRYPIGKMVMVNGKLYIVCVLGGEGDSCTICTYDTATGVATKLYDFDLHQPDGYIPRGGLVRGYDDKLYGMTINGGLNNNGVIYQWDPGTNNYRKLYDFDGYHVGPDAELLPATDRKLYGMTGLMQSGALFSFDPATSTYSELHTFPMYFGSQGGNPLIQASDGQLYGIVAGIDTSFIFSYDIISGTYTTLHTMVHDSVGLPLCGLTQAQDGKLYGITSISSRSHTGEIFSFDPATHQYRTLLPTDTVTGYNFKRNMTVMANGKLGFSAFDGGSNRQGALMTYDIAANTYAVLLSCDDSTGKLPECELYDDASALVISGLTDVAAATRPSLYPNPAYDKIYLDVPAASQYTVYSILGSPLLKGSVSDKNQSIDISGLPAGVYVIGGVRFVKL